jgi:hypothetical protein
MSHIRSKMAETIVHHPKGLHGASGMEDKFVPLPHLTKIGMVIELSKNMRRA